MPPRKKAAPKVEPQANPIEDAAPANEVDQPVVNQENPVDNAEDRTPQSEKPQDEDAAIKDAAPANDVDETVENQENPISSEEDRSEETTEEKDKEATKAWDTLAPAAEVDETVVNQMFPGENMVDRNPGPQIVEDSAGVAYDVSKPVPELVDPDAEATAQERARAKQTGAAMNAADFREENEDNVTIEFLSTGLSAFRHVWKAGETLRYKKSELRPWMKKSREEQEERYGRHMFKIVE
jgi:hypothetical protein